MSGYYSDSDSDDDYGGQNPGNYRRGGGRPGGQQGQGPNARPGGGVGPKRKIPGAPAVWPRGPVASGAPIPENHPWHPSQQQQQQQGLIGEEEEGEERLRPPQNLPLFALKEGLGTYARNNFRAQKLRMPQFEPSLGNVSEVDRRRPQPGPDPGPGQAPEWRPNFWFGSQPDQDPFPKMDLRDLPPLLQPQPQPQAQPQAQAQQQPQYNPNFWFGLLPEQDPFPKRDLPKLQPQQPQEPNFWFGSQPDQDPFPKMDLRKLQPLLQSPQQQQPQEPNFWFGSQPDQDPFPKMDLRKLQPLLQSPQQQQPQQPQEPNFWFRGQPDQDLFPKMDLRKLQPLLQQQQQPPGGMVTPPRQQQPRRPQPPPARALARRPILPSPRIPDDGVEDDQEEFVIRRPADWRQNQRQMFRVPPAQQPQPGRGPPQLPAPPERGQQPDLADLFNRMADWGQFAPHILHRAKGDAELEEEQDENFDPFMMHRPADWRRGPRNIARGKRVGPAAPPLPYHKQQQRSPPDEEGGYQEYEEEDDDDDDDNNFVNQPDIWRLPEMASRMFAAAAARPLTPPPSYDQLFPAPLRSAVRLPSLLMPPPLVRPDVRQYCYHCYHPGRDQQPGGGSAGAGAGAMARAGAGAGVRRLGPPVKLRMNGEGYRVSTPTRRPKGGGARALLSKGRGGPRRGGSSLVELGAPPSPPPPPPSPPPPPPSPPSPRKESIPNYDGSGFLGEVFNSKQNIENLLSAAWRQYESSQKQAGCTGGTGGAGGGGGRIFSNNNSSNQQKNNGTQQINQWFPSPYLASLYSDDDRDDDDDYNNNRSGGGKFQPRNVCPGNEIRPYPWIHYGPHRLRSPFWIGKHSQSESAKSSPVAGAGGAGPSGGAGGPSGGGARRLIRSQSPGSGNPNATHDPALDQPTPKQIAESVHSPVPPPPPQQQPQLGKEPPPPPPSPK